MAAIPMASTPQQLQDQLVALVESRDVEADWALTQILRARLSRSRLPQRQLLLRILRLGLATKPMAAVLAENAAEIGDLRLFEACHAWIAPGRGLGLLLTATEHGHLKIVQWMTEDYDWTVPGCSQQLLAVALGAGQLRICCWVAKVCPEWRQHADWEQLMEAAVRTGRLNVVVWLLEKSTEGGVAREINGARAYIEAARLGHHELAHWIWYRCLITYEQALAGGIAAVQSNCLVVPPDDSRYDYAEVAIAAARHRRPRLMEQLLARPWPLGITAAQLRRLREAVPTPPPRPPLPPPVEHPWVAAARAQSWDQRLLQACARGPSLETAAVVAEAIWRGVRIEVLAEAERLLGKPLLATEPLLAPEETPSGEKT